MSSDDLQGFIRDAAARPPGPVPLDAIVARARRRRARRRSTALLVPLLLLVLGGVALTGLAEPRVGLVPADEVTQPDAEPTHPSPEPTPQEEPTAVPAPREDAAASEEPPPSQSAEDAARDGVVPEVAALPFDVRVDAVDMGRVTRIETDEGVWVLSRPVLEHIELADLEHIDLAGGCALGATEDPDAVQGRDVICVLEYGEVLLLDPDESEILRAFPLPGLPPQTLAVTDDAVYCMRQGDGALPHSALCRIDRSTHDWFVRIFPSAAMSIEDSGVYLRDGWQVDEPVKGPLFDDLLAVEDRLIAVGHDHLIPVDPATLELEDPGTMDASRAFGSIAEIDAEARQLALDPAEFLTGEEADRAYEQETGDRSGVPNDYYIHDPDDEALHYRIGADVEVSLSRPWAPHGSTDLWERFASIWADETGTPDELFTAAQVRDAYYWLTVLDDEVIRIEQQYRP